VEGILGHLFKLEDQDGAKQNLQKLSTMKALFLASIYFN